MGRWWSYGLGNFVLEDHTDFVKVCKGPQIGTFLNRPLLSWHSMLAPVSGLFLVSSKITSLWHVHHGWRYNVLGLYYSLRKVIHCSHVNLSWHLITVGLIHTFIHWQRSLRHAGLVTKWLTIQMSPSWLQQLFQINFPLFQSNCVSLYWHNLSLEWTTVNLRLVWLWTAPSIKVTLKSNKASLK